MHLIICAVCYGVLFIKETIRKRRPPKLGMMQQVKNLYAIRFVLFKVYGNEIGGGGTEEVVRGEPSVYSYVLDSIAFKSEAATYY